MTFMSAAARGASSGFTTARRADLGPIGLSALGHLLPSPRLSAAQIQADVLLVYTLDTSFRIQGRGYGPLAAISLGVVPDRDAYITSTASALFIDVRTGFVYGVAEATAKHRGSPISGALEAPATRSASRPSSRHSIS